MNKRRKRIEALLTAQCLTYEEIGRRVGVSKQRVWQYAQRLEINGRKRQHTCLLTRIAKKAEDQMKEGLLANLLRHVPETFAFETVPATVQSVNQAIQDRRAVINGFRCVLMVASTDRRNPTPTVKIQSTKYSDFDFTLYYSKDNDLWVIVPRNESPKSATLFSLDRYWRGGGKDWMPFVNAWHLLAKRNEVAA